MQISLTLLVALLVFSSCDVRKEAAQPPKEEQSKAMQTPPPEKRDVSIPTMVKLDPEIQKYDDHVQSTRKKYETSQSPATMKMLVDALIGFGDYMTYESPVSPRQGKYHLALVQYYAALKLDPENTKVKSEIEQIESIYRDMGRPVPSIE